MVAVSVKARKAKQVYPCVRCGEEGEGYKERAERSAGQMKCNFEERIKDQDLPSPGCSPDCPGRSSAGRGQQLGGRRQPRAARCGLALGDTRFECGARDSQSSLPVPVPEAIANRELSCGEWVCAGVSTKGPAPLPAGGERRAPLGLREKREHKVWTALRRGWEGISVPAAASLLHPPRGPLCTAAVALHVSGCSRRLLQPSSLRRFSARLLGSPASPLPLGFRGHDPHPPSAKVRLLLTLTRPE